jgi:putative component of membrane protein insertase Oxa1/YidC/SpoIIIJ protein YidD
MKRVSKERVLRAGKRFGLALLITVATLIVFSKPLAVASINGYQKYVSPYKGYSCAYRVEFGKASCSGYAKSAINEHGLFVGVLELGNRFKHCHYAHTINGPRSQAEPLCEVIAMLFGCFELMGGCGAC